jgi:hypothetical protein
MRVAVVGAGIFGSTTALHLADVGHDVTLFEELPDVMSAASKVNQLRLHVGYHYPRSQETVSALAASVPSFMRVYGSVTYSPVSSHYAIPKVGSLVSPTDFKFFCERNSLPITQDRCDHISSDLTAFSVIEKLIDYEALKSLVKSRLKSSSVKVQLSRRFETSDICDFDAVVNCTYSKLNEILLESERRDYQFELCEKIVVNVPESLRGRSVVIIDGPFMCIDTTPRGVSLMGNVVHAIVSSSVGKLRHEAGSLGCYIDGEVHAVRSISNFDKFVESGRRFIPDLADVTYVGSMFTYRTVLPNVDKTDERPTLVSRSSSGVINVFSGKIDTCVNAAPEVVRLLS